jgi:hypothetical protein
MLTDRHLARIKTIRLIRAAFFAVVGVGLVAAVIRWPHGTVETTEIGVLAAITLGITAVLVAVARKGKPPLLPKVVLPLSVFGMMVGLLLAWEGIGHLYSQTATATAGNCAYVPAFSSYNHSSHHTTYTPPHYSCSAAVTWPDGTSSTFTVQQNNSAPQVHTFVREFGVLQSEVTMSWSEALAYTAIAALLMCQGLSAAAIFAVTRWRPKHPSGGLPPGMLPT